MNAKNIHGPNSPVKGGQMTKVKCKCGDVAYEVDETAVSSVSWTCTKCGKANYYKREAVNDRKTEKESEPIKTAVRV